MLVAAAVFWFTRTSEARLQPRALAFAGAWLGASVALRWWDLQDALGGSTRFRTPPAPPWDETLLSPSLIPVWLSLGAVAGCWALGRRDRRLLALCLLAVAAGLGPAWLHAPTDPTHSGLELFRYGTPALPWLALLAAAGLAGLAGLTPRYTQRLQVAAAGFVMLTPLLTLDVLARSYGPAAEAVAFRAALADLPADCQLVVPDDRGDHRRAGRQGTAEIAKLYAFLAAEVDPELAQRLVPLDDLLQGRAPDANCRYFFRGVYCAVSLEGTASPSCAELAERAPLTPMGSYPIAYRSHRLVTRPAFDDAPWVQDELQLGLYRVGRLSPALSGP